MRTLSYTESRARYAEVLDSVVNDREEVVITRAGHEPVVIMSLDDYESLRETAYLMRSPGQRPPPARRHGAPRGRRRRAPRPGRPRLSMLLVWDANAWEDYLWWQAQDRKVLKRINCCSRTFSATATRASASPSRSSTTSPATGRGDHRRAPARLQGHRQRDPHRRVPVPLRPVTPALSAAEADVSVSGAKCRLRLQQRHARRIARSTYGCWRR